jgi:hypothetical protein
MLIRRLYYFELFQLTSSSGCPSYTSTEVGKLIISSWKLVPVTS